MRINGVVNFEMFFFIFGRLLNIVLIWVLFLFKNFVSSYESLFYGCVVKWVVLFCFLIVGRIVKKEKGYWESVYDGLKCNCEREGLKGD